MKIITEIMSLDDLKVMAGAMFGDLVKDVVDAEREDDQYEAFAGEYEPGSR